MKPWFVVAIVWGAVWQVQADFPDATRVYVGPSEFTRRLGFQPAAFRSSGLEILARDDYLILDGPVRHSKASPYHETYVDYRYLAGSVITADAPARPADFPSPGLKAWQDFCGERFTTDHINDGPGGFNRTLGLFVNDDLGPWYAVAELLEQLGVRWYMPYEDGTVIPERKTIVIPSGHVKREARFPRREWCYYGTMRSDAEGLAWLKRLKAGNHHLCLYNHTTYAIYSSYEQQRLHPEYLARDSQGKPYLGYPSGRGMPRFTEPGFRRAAATFMNKVFQSQPDLSMMTVGPPDGGVKMDARDVSRYGLPTDNLEHKASNYVWDFHVYLARELKRSHPGKYLLYMSGAGAAGLPTNIGEFPDNLLISPEIGSSSSWALESHRRASVAGCRKWLDKMSVVRRAPAWDYWLNYRSPTHPRYPVVFTEALQVQMREIQSYADGKFIEIQPAEASDARNRHLARLGVPGLMHLMVYWQNRLFWDPDADRQQTLGEYYRLFFGPAEAEMREFYEFAEKVWCRQESRSLTESTGFLKEPDVTRYFEILSRARTKAGKDPVYDRRIAAIEGEMQSLKKLFPNLKRTGPLVQAQPAPEPAVIDGNLKKYHYGWTALRDITTGETPLNNLTQATVALTPDKKSLIVAVLCHENRMGQLKADCRTNDSASIFQDDVIEIYLNTPERSYFKIVVNPNGAIWDETTDVAVIDRDTLPILWNPGVKAVVRKLPDRWTAEILIPTKDFGALGPTREYPWGIQIGRTRWRNGNEEAWAIAPTGGGPYKTLNRWGNLWMR